MKTLLPLALLLVMPVLSGCPENHNTDDDDNSQEYTFGDYTVTVTTLETTHLVGTTDCPQEIVRIEITNTGSAEGTPTAQAGEDTTTMMYPVDLVWNGTRVDYGYPLSVTVPAGGTEEVIAEFNCYQTTSFTVPVELDDGNGGTTSVDVSLTVNE